MKIAPTRLDFDADYSYIASRNGLFGQVSFYPDHNRPATRTGDCHMSVIEEASIVKRTREILRATLPG